MTHRIVTTPRHIYRCSALIIVIWHTHAVAAFGQWNPRYNMISTTKRTGIDEVVGRLTHIDETMTHMDETLVEVLDLTKQVLAKTVRIEQTHGLINHTSAVSSTHRNLFCHARFVAKHCRRYDRGEASAAIARSDCLRVFIIV